MLPVLRALPYFEDVTELAVAGRIVGRALPFQIVVWVAVTPVEEFEPPDFDARFPAILDTGHNSRFAISPTHLRAWAKLDWKTLPLEGGKDQSYLTIPVPTRRANLWLYPNQYGWRDFLDPLRRPVPLEINEGIAIFGDGEAVGPDPRTSELRSPRLPILGLRALTEARVELRIDAVRSAVWMELPEAIE